MIYMHISHGCREEGIESSQCFIRTQRLLTTTSGKGELLKGKRNESKGILNEV